MLSTLRKYFDLGLRILPAAGQIPAALELATNIFTDIHRAMNGGDPVTPEMLATAERQTDALVKQIEDDVAKGQ